MSDKQKPTFDQNRTGGQQQQQRPGQTTHQQQRPGQPNAMSGNKPQGNQGMGGQGFNRGDKNNKGKF